MIQPGSPAPDFALPDQDSRPVSLGDFAGRRLILAFYPGDFSRVCSEQLSVYQEVLPEIEAKGAALLGVSVDSHHCHRAFADALHLTMPLLADFHPKGEVSRAYGAYIDERGHDNRSLVLVDQGDTVRWSYESPPLEVPGANLIFDALGG